MFISMSNLKILALAGLAIVSCLLLVVRFCPVTRQPSKYPKGSEMYYLAWIDHGRSAQKAAAAYALSKLNRKTQYHKALLLRNRYSDPIDGILIYDGVIGDMLLLSLFDMAPEEQRLSAIALMNRKYDERFGWVKTDDVFEGEVVDFYFDGPGEAALRLLSHGNISARAIEILLDYSRSFYLDDRIRAKDVFDLFPEMPAYDPYPQPTTINDLPEITRQQISAIQEWLKRNIDMLRWSSSKRAYRISATGG